MVSKGLGMKIVAVLVEAALKARRSHSIAISLHLCFMLRSGARNVNSNATEPSWLLFVNEAVNFQSQMSILTLMQ